MTSPLTLQPARALETFDAAADAAARPRPARKSAPGLRRPPEAAAPPAAPDEVGAGPRPLSIHEGGASPRADQVVLPATMERLVIARTRIRDAAHAGARIRTYEIALDLDMSEFHFARQFRLAFDRSPHVYYDEVRAEVARGLLDGGLGEGVVARRIGFRRPAELRALLAKRPVGTLPDALR